MSDRHQAPQGSGQQSWPSEQPHPNHSQGQPYPYGPASPASSGGPVPLWAPLYGASVTDAARRFFKKYATFSGRASRSEYWWWMLITFIVTFVLEMVALVGGSAGAKMGPNGAAIPGPGLMVGFALLGIWGLATLIPSLALAVRRLHDANFSGWMLLLSLIPFAGGIVLLVFTLLESKPEGQRFDDPDQQPVAWRP